FAKAWDKFHNSFAEVRPEQDSIPQNTVAFDQSTSPQDVEAAFAKESELARKLVRGDEDFWEVLLVEELLRTKLEQLNKDYDNLDSSLELVPLRRLTGRDYIHWLGTKTSELVPLMN